MTDTLNKELLKLLACPKCKGELFHENEIHLICRSCEVKYPVKNGIPILIVENGEPFNKGCIEKR